MTPSWWPASRGPRRSRGQHVVASRSTRNFEGPGCRQHRRVCVCQPGCAQYGHLDRELHSAAVTERRSELLRVRRRRDVRDPRVQSRRCPPGRHVSVPVPHGDPQSAHVPLQHRPDQLDRQPELEPAAVLLGHPGESVTAARKLLGSNLAVPPVNVGIRSTPNYASTFTGAATHACRVDARCSPGNALKASGLTWAASSTWAPCGRSSTCTSSRPRTRWASTARRGSTSTPSRSRSRRRISPPTGSSRPA